MEGLSFAVDESTLEALGATCGSLAVRTQSSCSRSGAGQRLRDHDVDADSIAAEPAAGVFSCGESGGVEQVAQQWRVRQLAGRDRAVRVGRVLGYG